ncbi:hypothetical protein ACIA5D_09830 [Actinoplanes sp. NPDC051513]|uniref:hypothetical protein n=1 Tax=Actinoplanes sp. NPDC051513 TaxID=3363908 RepID=UPI00378A19F5
MEFFTRSQLAEMRDPTRARRYSPAREEFRRVHARQRAWGLIERHARKLRRLHGGDDGSPLTAAERRLWSSGAGTPGRPVAPVAPPSPARNGQGLGSPARRVVHPAGNQLAQPAPAVLAAVGQVTQLAPAEQAAPAVAEQVTRPAPIEQAMPAVAGQAMPAVAEQVTQPAPTPEAVPAAGEQLASADQDRISRRRGGLRVYRIGSLRKNRHRGSARAPAGQDRTPPGPRRRPYSAAVHTIPSTVFRVILLQWQTPFNSLHRRWQILTASAWDGPGEIGAVRSGELPSLPHQRPAYRVHSRNSSAAVSGLGPAVSRRPGRNPGPRHRMISSAARWQLRVAARRHQRCRRMFCSDTPASSRRLPAALALGESRRVAARAAARW